MGPGEATPKSTAEAIRDRLTAENLRDWAAYIQDFLGYDQVAEDARDLRAMSDRTMYIDRDDYEFFIKLRAKSSLFKYSRTIIPYAIFLVFAYFLYSHAMSMIPNSEYARPSWALLYVPMIILVFLKAFNQLSAVKISV